MTTGDPIDLGLELLTRLEHEELPLADVVDRIETITVDPHLTRTILEEADRRGIIQRTGRAVRLAGGNYVRFQSEVVQKSGEFSCKRCGATLSTGHFINLESGTVGPFGSSCIRKIIGRE